MNKKVLLVLKDVLDEKGVTRYELAKRTGVPFPTIDRYYKNKNDRYDTDILLRICLALGCEVGDIMKIKEV